MKGEAKKIYARDYYQKHKEEILERVKKRYQSKKKEIRKYWKMWREKNKERWLEYSREHSKIYYRENKEKRKKYYADRPWSGTLRSILRRCNSEKDNSWYYRKGIKNYLTGKELKEIWFRDKAYLMENPSIHRIKGGHYTYDNVKFVELEENLKGKKHKYKQEVLCV